MTTESIRKLFYPSNPFADFDASGYEPKLKGWHSDRPIFKELIQRQKPELYIEVGTWLGASAIHAATVMQKAGLECPVICIDTWLGAQEFWQDVKYNERYQDLAVQDGYPSVFRQFMANVVHAGHAGRIVPLPQTSLIAARLLAAHHLKAGLIYIDCSHDEGDVLRDLEAYWEVLEPGGILFGDDYDEYWPGLVLDVNRFAADHGLKVDVDHGSWILQKPTGASQPSASMPQADERDLRVALQTENAILRSRLISLQSHIEIIRGERDQSISAMAERLRIEQNTAGYYADKIQKLEAAIRNRLAGKDGAVSSGFEENLRRLLLTGETDTIENLLSQMQEMESRAAYFASRATELEHLLKYQHSLNVGSSGKAADSDPK